MARLIRFALLPAVAMAVLGHCGPAAAAEYCVTCTGPDAQYRCEVGSNNAVDARAWLQCITELAKEGSHDSCSVDRKATSPCPGIHKILAVPDGAAPQPPVPVQTAVPEPPPAQAAAPEGLPGVGEPATKRVPATMKELAGDTYEASKEGLKKAGDTVSETAKKAGDAVTGTAKSAGDGLSKAGSAVGDAAKKTWTCVTSLFQSC